MNNNNNNNSIEKTRNILNNSNDYSPSPVKRNYNNNIFTSYTNSRNPSYNRLSNNFDSSLDNIINNRNNLYYNYNEPLNRNYNTNRNNINRNNYMMSNYLNRRLNRSRLCNNLNNSYYQNTNSTFSNEKLIYNYESGDSLNSTIFDDLNIRNRRCGSLSRNNGCNCCNNCHCHCICCCECNSEIALNLRGLTRCPKCHNIIPRK